MELLISEKDNSQRQTGIMQMKKKLNDISNE
jgi:hypothetical protein